MVAQHLVEPPGASVCFTHRIPHSIFNFVIKFLVIILQWWMGRVVYFSRGCLSQRGWGVLGGLGRGGWWASLGASLVSGIIWGGCSWGSVRWGFSAVVGFRGPLDGRGESGFLPLAWISLVGGFL